MRKKFVTVRASLAVNSLLCVVMKYASMEIFKKSLDQSLDQKVSNFCHPSDTVSGARIKKNPNGFTFRV